MKNLKIQGPSEFNDLNSNEFSRTVRTLFDVPSSIE